MSSLIDQFQNDLNDLVDKYSDMEMTSAEAIGVLEFKKHDILMSGFEVHHEDIIY